MNLLQVIQRLKSFVKPYNKMVYVSLLLTFIGSLLSTVNPVVLKYVVDSVEHLLKQGLGLKEGTTLLIWVTVIFIGKELISVVIQYGQKFLGEKIRVGVSADLAQYSIEKVLTYRMAFFVHPNNQSGKLQTRIDRGVESLTRLIQNIFIDILPLFANAIVALVVMFYANVYVGLVAISVMPIYFYISYWQAEKLQGARRKFRMMRERKTNGLFTMIESIVVVKSFVQEKYEGIKQNDLQQDLVQTQLQTRKTNFFYDGLKSLIEQLGLVFIIILTVYFVLGLTMSLGAIMFHIMLFNNVSAPIRQLHRTYDEVNEALTFSEGFFEILDNTQETEETGNIKSTGNLEGTFELKNVHFTYPNGTKALFNVNLVIPKGKTTALVGLSGAGKSTIIQLLSKFYLPDSGKILLDGKDLSAYDTYALRQNIGIVLQKNHIFKGSIEENIRYGKKDSTFSNVVDAAKKAYLHEQIIQLPEGYQSEAQMLSGGQQQRVAIARLFLKNPPVIFLDEPTASLDAITSEQIKNSIDAIKKDRTAIIISHSISQIIDSDIIYVLKTGNMVEKGIHEELYEKKGIYTEIFDASARSLNIERIARTMAI